MKERPVIFKGEMVQAVLEGRKTQTRRLIKPQPPVSTYWKESEKLFIVEDSRLGVMRKCPLGLAGDRLWVRETFFIDECRGDDIYGHTGPVVFYRSTDFSLADKNEPDYIKWRPSIHMPRWASRIDLENVIDPYPQRVQEISEEDAIAEGIRRIFIQGVPWFFITESGGPSFEWGREAYAALWDSIHGKDAWGRNDWVWVISFKRVK